MSNGCPGNAQAKQLIICAKCDINHQRANVALTSRTRLVIDSTQKSIKYRDYSHDRLWKTLNRLQLGLLHYTNKQN